MILALLRRRVGPEVPRADANLLGDIVDTEDGTTGIAAGDDQGLGGAWDGILNNLAGERLPLALDG